MVDDETPIYIKGEKQETTKEPPAKQPGFRSSIDDALQRLQSKREGRSVSDREPPRSRTDEAADLLAAERSDAKASAEREARNQRLREAEKAESQITRSAEWHEDDVQTLQHIQQEVSEFEAAKAKLAEAQRYAKQHPDRVSAQQRQDLEEANNRLLQKQNDLQQKGAKVQEAAQTKSLRTEQAKLLRDVPELADENTREEFLSWAEDQGIPRDVAEGETNRVAVTQAFRAFEKEQKEKRQKHLNRPRKPLQRRPGLPSELTVEQARKELKKGGTMTDALNLLHLQRERSNEAQKS